MPFRGNDEPHPHLPVVQAWTTSRRASGPHVECGMHLILGGRALWSGYAMLPVAGRLSYEACFGIACDSSSRATDPSLTGTMYPHARAHAAEDLGARIIRYYAQGEMARSSGLDQRPIYGVPNSTYPPRRHVRRTPLAVSREHVRRNVREDSPNLVPDVHLGGDLPFPGDPGTLS